MIKKFIVTMIAALLLLLPMSAFADDSTSISENSTHTGYFSDGNSSIKSNSSISDLAITPPQWGVMTVQAQVLEGTIVEANWSVTSNDYIYSAELIAELQRWDPEDYMWVTVDTKGPRDLYFNPSTKTPKGQFNFQNVTSPGDYRVMIYGTMEGRYNQLELITSSPYSNTVTIGGIVV
ncbi:hypothetical protein [Paenibacillus caui]|uniref:hypothetical protein n=1 Tax=Paenibacillus caui TaxID=2873927 RepID=UPI001CA7CBA7|nr:hypothetical protein [Paenibacillus caui]